jgi:hypothetical protein
MTRIRGKTMKQNLIHENLSGEIIGAAIAVMNELKPGLDEKLYENALIKGHLIGTLIPDMIVDELVVVDPKVVTVFNENHVAQMLGYLAITGLDLALLLNFKHSKVGWKRIVQR